MAKMAPSLGHVLFSTDFKLAAITILDNPGVQIDMRVLHRFQPLVISLSPREQVAIIDATIQPEGMMSDPEAPLQNILKTGSCGPYLWLRTELEMISLLRSCPQIVLGKYIAITSVDSGILKVGEEERARGWESRGEVGYSPRVSSIEELPLSFLIDEHYHEWFVFRAPADLGQRFRGNVFMEPLRQGMVAAFVNYRIDLSKSDEGSKELLHLFWDQLERIQPESYLADGDDFLTFASRDKELFHEVCSALATIGNA
jgi:hypothetical protein